MNRTAYLALMVAVVADVVTTYLFRSKGLPEANPLVAGWVDTPAVFIGVKLGMVGAVVWIAAKHNVTRWNTVVWIIATIIGAAAVVNLSTWAVA